ncbi:response regulator [Lacicoccus qingdaonensis]|uniref:Transcriptional regulatory protein n=1 Tax=Lacicoccus qingdaonensis TaxID=576118 RepID=A0A1G9BYV5_9BACL|nr:response regulator [Salinicoccus qingdaonensis]SDK44639.1 two-component system, CitB family, response regulator CitT [Salinicoccus qingdaonensis]
METLKVAIAEDDYRVADVHEKFLEKISGIEVVGKALNAEKTLELLDTTEVDLLLLDVYMPDQLGTDIIPTIRQNYENVDIIMITAATDKTFVERAMRHGVQNYLIKPITIDRFTNTIEQYLKDRNLLKNKEEVNQDVVDKLFKNSEEHKRENEQMLPTGIDANTLHNILEVLKTSQDGLSAEEIGEKMGASRTTARRYLEYLISIDECRSEVEYGAVGRPERKYLLG